MCRLGKKLGAIERTGTRESFGVYVPFSIDRVEDHRDDGRMFT